MKKQIKILLGLLLISTVLMFNVVITTNANDHFFLKIENSISHAYPPLPPFDAYVPCLYGTTTSAGNDGAQMARWCGDCGIHAIYALGNGNCMLYSWGQN